MDQTSRAPKKPTKSKGLVKSKSFLRPYLYSTIARPKAVEKPTDSDEKRACLFVSLSLGTYIRYTYTRGYHLSLVASLFTDILLLQTRTKHWAFFPIRSIPSIYIVVYSYDFSSEGWTTRSLLRDKNQRVHHSIVTSGEYATFLGFCLPWSVHTSFRKTTTTTTTTMMVPTLGTSSPSCGSGVLPSSDGGLAGDNGGVCRSPPPEKKTADR